MANKPIVIAAAIALASGAIIGIIISPMFFSTLTDKIMAAINSSGGGSGSAPSFYSISVAKSGNGFGYVGVGSGTYTFNSSSGTCYNCFQSGKTVSLVANPYKGYKFVSWSGCDKKSGATCKVTMKSDKSVTVEFASKQLAVQNYNLKIVTYPDTSGTKGYVINYNKNDSGTDVSKKNICYTSGTTNTSAATYKSVGSGTCEVSYPKNSTVYLTLGGTYVSYNFGKDCKGNSCTLTMDGDKEVWASFTSTTAENYTLKIVTSIDTTDTDSFYGYVANYNKNDDNDVSNKNICFTTGKSDNSGVGYKSTGSGTCEVSYPKDSIIYLTFGGKSVSYEFTSGGCSGTSCILKMDKDRTIKAEFEKK